VLATTVVSPPLLRDVFTAATPESVPGEETVAGPPHEPQM
jgi:hypothetical protein